jgi:hypothetical protein
VPEGDPAGTAPSTRVMPTSPTHITSDRLIDGRRVNTIWRNDLRR